MALVRRAVVADAAGMAAVHVASWQTTYAGVLPAAYIAERTWEARKAFWTDRLTEADPAVFIFVACADDGSICGFASGGPERTGKLDADGELYSLYLLREAQGQGLGRRLVRAVMNELRGARRVAVWVLGVNPARGFYERLGGRVLVEQEADMGGKMYAEVAYDLGPG